MRLKWITLLLLLPFLAACSSDDDLEGIFVGQTWYVTEVFGADGEPALDDQQRAEIRTAPNSYYITFNQQTFIGLAGAVQFGGRWEANGDAHTIQFHLDNEGTHTPISTQITAVLRTAARYAGDYTNLSIISKDGPRILFRPTASK